MKTYFIFLLYLLVFGGLAQYNNLKMNNRLCNNVDGVENNYVTKSNAINLKDNKYRSNYGIWILLLFFGLFFIQAFRYYVGMDYYYYLYMHVDWDFVVDKFKIFDEPIGYLLSFVARSIWNHPLANIVCFSFVLTLLFFIGLKNYDRNDIMLIVVLYTITGPLLFAFNGIFQAMAVNFIFAFSKKSEKNSILKYVIVILIASLIHKSSLMFLPILILSQFKINKYQMFLMLSCSFLIPAFYGIGYEFMGITDLNEAYIQEQINPIRVLVAFAPLIFLIFIDRKKFVQTHYFETNMAIMNAILSLTTFNSAYLNRFTNYTAIYLIVFIPACLKQFPKKVRIILTFVVVALYTAFWAYEIYNNDSLRDFEWIFPYLRY